MIYIFLYILFLFLISIFIKKSFKLSINETLFGILYSFLVIFILTNKITTGFIQSFFGNIGNYSILSLIGYYIFVSIVEESFKLLIPFFLIIKKEINKITGIILLIALTFSIIESIMYIIHIIISNQFDTKFDSILKQIEVIFDNLIFFGGGGEQNVFLIFLMRIVFSTLVHGATAIIFGLFLIHFMKEKKFKLILIYSFLILFWHTSYNLVTISKETVGLIFLFLITSIHLFQYYEYNYKKHFFEKTFTNKTL